MRRELWVNGMDLSYEWEKKRVKNLNLRVRPDGSIHVSTAGWVPVAAVDDFVRSRADLIQKARLRWQNERPSEAFAVEDGAVLPCMGREMTLMLRNGSPKGAAVQGDLRGGFCGGAGKVVPPLCPMEYSETGAASPPHEEPLGELSACHGGHYDERAAAALSAGVYRIHHGA